MDPLDPRRHLFINSTGPIHGRSRDRTTARSIRQHVMRDIAQSRRKMPRNPQVALVMRGPADETQRSNRENISNWVMQQHESVYCPDGSYGSVLTGPFWSQHPLAVLNFGCGMDAFAAYGLALAATAFERKSGGQFSTSRCFHAMFHALPVC